LDKYAVAARRLVALIGQEVTADFAVELWTGEILPLGPRADTTLRVRISGPDAITRLLRRPSFARLAELLADGSIAVEGGTLLDLAARRGSAKTKGLLRKLNKGKLARNLWPFLVRRVPKAEAGQQHGFEGRIEDTVEKGREDKPLVQFHYDISNAFYALFLGPTMAYTCAYWRTPESTLDDAQNAKFEMICRKLRLKPGERLLDIGCGWGGLVTYAAKHYGVVAHGVTLAQEQFDFAHERVAKEGLEGRVSIELKDYRDLDGRYDKIASIGMFEHVGAGNHAAYFTKIKALLANEGLYLHHAITRPMRRSSGWFKRERPEFTAITRYIFPGAELDDIGLTVRNLEQHGFEVHDVEAWRRHYARTTRAWAEALYEKRAVAQTEVGEAKLRIWLLYLAGCSLGFERGSIGIYQTLVSKRTRGDTRVPLTREDLYA
jgi:cyclopropane-fatty-acyl-phospholipid synthase